MEDVAGKAQQGVGNCSGEAVPRCTKYWSGENNRALQVSMSRCGATGFKADGSIRQSWHEGFMLLPQVVLQDGQSTKHDLFQVISSAFAQVSWWN